MKPSWFRLHGALAFALAGIAAAHPALAQDGGDARLRRLEAEVRALQRKAFPGREAGAFQPEITRPAAAPGEPAQPTTSAVTDLLTRMDALEAQIARLTGQTELNANRLAQIEAKLAPAPTPEALPGTTPPAAAPSAPAANISAMSGGASTASETRAGDREPSSQRLDAVRAIAKPQTGDAGDDEYSYGYRLWAAGFHAEAGQQLKLFIETYPRHTRISYARNLLGRTYFDDGNPREAAKWFLQNYQADKAGARASDSLLYLSRSMGALGDNKRACIALSEFAANYAAEAAGRLKADYDATRRGLSCG